MVVGQGLEVLLPEPVVVAVVVVAAAGEGVEPYYHQGVLEGAYSAVHYCYGDYWDPHSYYYYSSAVVVVVVAFVDSDAFPFVVAAVVVDAGN